MPAERHAPVAAVVLAAVLFGTAGTALELGPDDAEPLGVAAARVAIGTSVLWIVVGAQRSWSWIAVRGQLRLVVLGGLGVAVYTPLFLGAVERSGVAVSTIITISSGPFVAAAIESVWRDRRPSPRWLFGTTLTIGGAALLVMTSTAADKRIDAIGVALALAAGAGYGTYSVAAKATIERGLDSTLALAAPFTIGSILLIAAAAIGASWGWLGSFGGLALAAYLGVFATGVAYVLFGFGLARLTAATTVTLVLAEPVTAAVLAALVLDERISSIGWIGISIVAVGLWIVGRGGAGSSQGVAAASARR